MTRKVTNDHGLSRATSGTPRRNALIPEQSESSCHASSSDRDLTHQPRHEASPGNNDKEPPKPLPHPATPPRPPRPDGRASSPMITQADQPLSRSDNNREPPKPLPHPATPPRPPRPDGRPVLTTTTDHLIKWPQTCDILAGPETNERVQHNSQKLKEGIANMISKADAKEFVRVIVAYCDIKSTLRSEDDEELLHVLMEKVRGEGVVEALWREGTFHGLLGEKKYAKGVVGLFGSALVGKGVDLHGGMWEMGPGGIEWGPR